MEMGTIIVCKFWKKSKDKNKKPTNNLERNAQNTGKNFNDLSHHASLTHFLYDTHFDCIIEENHFEHRTKLILSMK